MKNDWKSLFLAFIDSLTAPFLAFACNEFSPKCFHVCLSQISYILRFSCQFDSSCPLAEWLLSISFCRPFCSLFSLTFNFYVTHCPDGVRDDSLWTEFAARIILFLSRLPLYFRINYNKNLLLIRFFLWEKSVLYAYLRLRQHCEHLEECLWLWFHNRSNIFLRTTPI